MNEQIKQLAEQASVSSLWMSGTDQQGNPILEKFAQLIVQECLTICQHNADDDDDQFDLGRVHQAKEITYLIKKHFGVEP